MVTVTAFAARPSTVRLTVISPRPFKLRDGSFRGKGFRFQLNRRPDLPASSQNAGFSQSNCKPSLGAVMGGIVPVPISPQLTFKNIESYHDTVAHVANAAGASMLLTTTATRQ